MPRKDKKKKTKAKKPKALKYSPIPPKGKPCLECGNKTGSAFSIPFGYADLLGTQRLGSVSPIININNYLRDIPIKMDVVKPKVASLKAPKYSVPYIPLDESVISLEPTRKNVTVGVNPFVGYEDIYNSPFRSIGETRTTGESISDIYSPARGGIPNPLQRSRRTDVEIVADLMVQQKPDMTYEDAIAYSLELSKTKGALKDKKQQLKKEGK